MKKLMAEIEPEFVDTIPSELDDGRLYIALKYRTVTHKCACGCGVEINTPLHPTGWAITYDGAKVSLRPSVGNWGEKCRSHYWIDKNRIYWSRPWTREEIQAGRQERFNEIKEYYDETKTDLTGTSDKELKPRKCNLLDKWKKWLRFRKKTEN